MTRIRNVWTPCVSTYPEKSQFSYMMVCTEAKQIKEKKLHCSWITSIARSTVLQKYQISFAFVVTFWRFSFLRKYICNFPNSQEFSYSFLATVVNLTVIQIFFFYLLPTTLMSHSKFNFFQTFSSYAAVTTCILYLYSLLMNFVFKRYFVAKHMI